jgi:alpha-galactosidase
LAYTEGCLTDLGDGLVSITECSGATNQKWEYLYEGNMVSKSSRLCLTEGWEVEVVTTTCGYETNAQVFGLPSGVDIIGS